jgi:mRNA-degrading endonuclease RelE of RelBE toxin-antitoxin system
MLYKVLVSRTFQKKFNRLQKSIQNLIRKTLKELEKDPYISRPNCDIKLLKDTKPKKYRLRMSDYRFIYIIKGKEVKVIDLLKRETGYNKLE